MVAARLRPPTPGIGFTALPPLARNPPAPNFYWARWIGKIKDHDDIPDVAVDCRRDVGISSIEVEAVHPSPAGLPARHEFRLCRTRHIVNVDAATAIRPADAFLIDHHKAVGYPDLMRMPAWPHCDGSQHTRPGGVGNINDCCAVRRAHVTDVRRGAIHRDLPATRTVDLTH